MRRFPPKAQALSGLKDKRQDIRHASHRLNRHDHVQRRHPPGRGDPRRCRGPELARSREAAHPRGEADAMAAGSNAPVVSASEGRGVIDGHGHRPQVRRGGPPACGCASRPCRRWPLARPAPRGPAARICISPPNGRRRRNGGALPQAVRCCGPRSCRHTPPPRRCGGPGSRRWRGIRCQAPGSRGQGRPPAGAPHSGPGCPRPRTGSVGRT